MQIAQPAVLKPGITLDALPGPRPGDETGAGHGHVIRGGALIFWDPRSPGRKLDAIDTDQITPAADCVSESLETLDERWKAGAFRYLMPDFRARVHAGQTFVVAGDRFAIGSSREMSPAGLKAIAEEVGLEMVIVCGHNMGDIFRRNALNLGLHVVQSPEAVADAKDGDVFTFEPVSRALANETQGKPYTPVPLSAKEDEIRQSGGIFALGRREPVSNVNSSPSFASATASGLCTTWSPRLNAFLRNMSPMFAPHTTTSSSPASSATALRPAGLISRDEPIAKRSPATRKVSPRWTRSRKSGIRYRNAPAFQRSSSFSRLSETQSAAGVIWSVSMASSFRPGFFGSQKINARPRMTRGLSSPAVWRLPERPSRRVPGFRRAGSIRCMG